MNVPQFFLPAGGTDATISCHAYLNTGYWNFNKSLLISEILMEHLNAPILDPITSDWFLPPHRTDEQGILSASLDYCRFLTSEQQDIHYLLSNVLSSILAGRKELTGVDLSDLDLKSCCFFNVTCSRKGKHNTLAAIFHGSHIYKHNFEPENHLDSVIDTIYVEDHCLTLDSRGCLKCWDAFSGKLEYTLYAGDPTELYDFTCSLSLKLSPDKRWLVAKVQRSPAYPDKKALRLFIFDLDSPERNIETFSPGYPISINFF